MIPWTDVGLRLLAWFALAYGLFSFAALRWFPRWFVPALSGLLAAIGVWTAGPAALLAVALFVAAAITIGRDEDTHIAFAAGAAAISLAIYLTIGFAVHRAPVYWILLAAGAVGIRRRLSWRFDRPDLPRVLLYGLLSAYYLIALKPETGADALAMHLAIPVEVARNGYWPFDTDRYLWAVMPMAANWTFTAVYLPGGEAATRLVNFAFFAALSLMLARRSTSAALLFATTPLALLATGSLFVENYVALLVLAGWLVIERYREQRNPRDMYIAAFLLGSACSAKVGAIVFLPLLAYTSWRPALVALAAAAPPYAIAWWKTGNPIFPFANQFFHSPLFDPIALKDLRYQEPLQWTTLWDLTFHSSRFMEASDCALGFHYLLLPLALLYKPSRRVAAIALAAGTLLLSGQANLRYTYPVLPLASLAISALPVRAVVGFAALNFIFWNAATWSHRNFIATEPLPIPRLLARRAREGPVAMFGAAPFADLQVRGYSDTWHSWKFYSGLRAAKTPEDVHALMQSVGIRSVIAPRSGVPIVPVREYLLQYVEPAIVIDGWYIGRVRKERHLHEGGALMPGTFEDTDPAIRYHGPWLNDRQFPQTTDRSLTYTSEEGSTAEFRFRGRSFTWVFTKAANRGAARVDVDGVSTRVDLHSKTTEWGARRRFNATAAGEHTVRITVEKGFVDIDAVVIE